MQAWAGEQRTVGAPGMSVRPCRQSGVLRGLRGSVKLFPFATEERTPFPMQGSLQTSAAHSGVRLLGRSSSFSPEQCKTCEGIFMELCRSVRQSISVATIALANGCLFLRMAVRLYCITVKPGTAYATTRGGWVILPGPFTNLFVPNER